MNEKINNQQTLFRFVSLRAPEKSKKENQEKRFVFHPDNKSGVFFTAMGKMKSTQTKWEVLKNTASNFKAIQTEEEISKINPIFFEVSEWLSLNKSTAKNEEILKKISGVKTIR